MKNTSTYSFFKGDLGDYKANTPPYALSNATAWEQHDALITTAAHPTNQGLPTLNSLIIKLQMEVPGQGLL
jgi:hypothetical protein